MRVGKWVVALVGSALVAGSTYGCGGGGGGGGGGAAPPGGGTAPLTSGNAQWTFMVYVVANGDLAPYQVASLKALEKVGSTPDVHVVVQAQTASTFPAQLTALPPNANAFGLPFDTTTKRWKVERDPSFASNLGTPPKLISPMQAGFGVLDTTSPDTLRGFVNWTKTNYPARRYALVLSDHGGNWVGFGEDHAVNQLDYSPARLESFVRAASTALGNRIDVLGFDACNMASIEVMTLLSPHARVLVASEEVEIMSSRYGSDGAGWNYAGTLGTLVGSPTMSERALASVVVDTTATHWSATNPCFTISAVDLDATANVVSAFQRFAANRLAGSGSTLAGFFELGRARANSDDYSRGEDLAGRGPWVDMRSLLAQFQAQAPEQAAADAIGAIDAAVIRSARGPLRSGSTGITVNMPLAQNSSLVFAGNAYGDTLFAKQTQWEQVLTRFFTAVDQDQSAPAVQVSAGSGTTLTPGTFVSANFSVSDPDTTRISRVIVRRLASAPSTTRLQFISEIDTGLSGPAAGAVNWDGTTFVLTDGSVSDFMETFPVRAGSNLYYSIWVGDGQSGGPTVILAPILEVNPSTGTVNVLGVCRVLPKGLLTQFPLEALNGVSVRAVTRVFDSSSASQPISFEFGTTRFNPSVATPLRVALARVPSGPYSLSVVGYDFAGNTGSGSVDITVQ